MLAPVFTPILAPIFAAIFSPFATFPVAPTAFAAPSQTLSQTITAPVPARAVPSIVVPAIASPFPNVFNIFDQANVAESRLDAPIGIRSGLQITADCHARHERGCGPNCQSEVAHCFLLRSPLFRLKSIRAELEVTLAFRSGLAAGHYLTNICRATPPNQSGASGSPIDANVGFGTFRKRRFAAKFSRSRRLSECPSSSLPARTPPGEPAAR
jgi:hypothetical protein